MKYAMNLRAEENDKREDDPMYVDELGNRGTADQQSAASGNVTNWELLEVARSFLQEALWGLAGSGCFLVSLLAFLLVASVTSTPLRTSS